MRSCAEIAHLYWQRRSEAGAWRAIQEEVRSVVNGEVAVPMPGRWKDERPAEANLVQIGIDQTAQRIASTMADVSFPSTRPGVKLHDQRSRDRRRAAGGWLERTSYDLVTARRARYLVGYACSPVKIAPDFDLAIPGWESLNPLGTYPAPLRRGEDMVPDDCVFSYLRTLDWLKRAYPAQAGFLRPRATTIGRGMYQGADERVEMVEFIDADHIVMIATGTGYGPAPGTGGYGDTIMVLGDRVGGYRWSTELIRLPNRAGRPLVAVPGRISLDGMHGQFDAMIPKYITQARIAALELMAIEDGIVPDEWVVTHASSGNQPAVIEVQADGRKGIVGQITGGTITTVNRNPGYKTDQYLARLERSQRIEGGVPAAFGGESPTNVRTGRLADQVLGAAVDFPIAEHQKILARSEQAEIEIAVEVAKGWFGKRSVSFHVDWRGAKGPVTYTAKELFEAPCPVKVRYSLAGADLNALTVRAGQKLGTGLISQATARAMDPEIEDAEHERDAIVAETLERAMLDAIASRAADGSMSPADVAFIMAEVATAGTDLAAAIEAADKRASERQASSGEPGTPTGPVDPNSPEAQPGLAVPGSGAEAGLAIPEPPDEMTNLTTVLRQAGTHRQALVGGRR